VDRVGVHDHFFELGGNSLRAIALLSLIETEFGQRVPLTTMFQATTIAELAEVLASQSASAHWASLVPMHREGDRRPFFFVHALDGLVLAYADLARHLALDRPVYGLQAVGFDPASRPLESIDEMAAHYIRAMRSVQPEGPYLLGGWSAGGVVAFEMAQQLRRQQEGVAFLAILDTGAPIRGYRYGLSEYNHMAAEVVEFARRIEQETRYELGVTYEELRDLDVDEMLERFLARIEGLDLPIPPSGKQALRAGLRVIELVMKATKTYSPKSYPGPLTVFSCLERTSMEIEVGTKLGYGPSLGWEQYSPEVQVQMIPGHHRSMLLEPQVGALATHLRRYLAATDRRFVHRTESTRDAEHN
jgi:thioesterase domain-containing protein/acyl carrier protein